MKVITMIMVVLFTSPYHNNPKHEIHCFHSCCTLSWYNDSTLSYLPWHQHCFISHSLAFQSLSVFMWLRFVHTWNEEFPPPENFWEGKKCKLESIQYIIQYKPPKKLFSPVSLLSPLALMPLWSPQRRDRACLWNWCLEAHYLYTWWLYVFIDV